MSLPRRSFIGWLGATGLVAGTGVPTVGPARRTPHPQPVDDTWDMSWLDRVQGKYRAVFDSPAIDDGEALFRACIWRDQYREVYGTAREEMTPVLVFRAKGIPLVMNDEYWGRFKIGKREKVKDYATDKWATINPIRVAAPGTPEKYKDVNLESFLGQGGIVLGCSLAFRMVVADYRKKDKLSREDAVRVAKEHLIPGVILQPSGVFAVLRAQAEGCHYIMAS